MLATQMGSQLKLHRGGRHITCRIARIGARYMPKILEQIAPTRPSCPLRSSQRWPLGPRVAFCHNRGNTTMSMCGGGTMHARVHLRHCAQVPSIQVHREHKVYNAQYSNDRCLFYEHSAKSAIPVSLAVEGLSSLQGKDNQRETIPDIALCQ